MYLSFLALLSPPTFCLTASLPKLTEFRSKRTNNQPLRLSKASNSLQFTTQAARYNRQTAPAPEPIGKRGGALSSSQEQLSNSASATEILLTKKSISRTNLSDYDYDIPGLRRPRSRPPSIRSTSRKSSVRSVRSRTTPHRQSIETIRSRASAASSGSRLSGKLDRLIIEEPASLINIPTELVHAIVQYLPRSDLLNIVCVCKQLRAETIMLLYAKPYFISTYRFAQFVTTVSHNARLAELVRDLDLSHFSKLPKALGLAGWREWKYRSEPLYNLAPADSGNETRSLGKKHPPAHPLLLKYSPSGHDVSLGALMHVVNACTRLRFINLNDLHISADYVILPSAPPPRWKPLLPINKPPTYHPTAFTNLLFISDVPRSNTWRGTEFRTLRYDEFVNALCSLPDLEVLYLRRAVWLKRAFAEEIVKWAGGDIGLREVNFTECGMNPGMSSWTRKWYTTHTDTIRSLRIFE